MSSLLRGETMKPILFPLAVGLGMAVATAIAGARQNQPGAAALRVLAVQGNVHMIAGAGGNIAVQTGRDGVVVVDAGSGGMADAVIAAIRKLSDQPIRYIISTGPDVDHLGGNEKLAQAGKSLFPSAMNSNMGGAAIIGTEALLRRMSAPTGSVAPYPVVAWPTETFNRRLKSLHLNGEGIQVMAEPAAHSDGDSIVLFRGSDVIATGDIVDITRFPMIDIERGGTINGEIAALNHLIDLAIPSIPLPFLDEGGTRIIPGHGRICEEAELVEYRDMVTIIRDRVQQMIADGMTLEQVNAANPTTGFRTRYGSESGRWTTSMFVEAVYSSLRRKT
jgi:glyoxylase-like metal-dependent hydrolase (beta-lactamase superfamily II)